MFDVADLWLLLAIASVMFFASRHDRRTRGSSETLLWGAGALAFGVLFVFLARHVAQFSYEYVFELYPAFVLMLTAGALRVCRINKATALLGVSGIVVYFGGQAVGVLLEDHPARPNHVRNSVLVAALKLEETLSQETPGPMPRGYTCYDRPPHSDLVERHGGFTLYGWNRGGDCTVAVATELFLPFERCVDIVIKRGPASRGPLRERAGSFLARVGVDWLNVTGIDESLDGRARVTMCRDEARTERIELVTIGWVRPHELPRIDVDPVYVESIGARSDSGAVW